jgi:hypothetical protein
VVQKDAITVVAGRKWIKYASALYAMQEPTTIARVKWSTSYFRKTRECNPRANIGPESSKAGLPEFIVRNRLIEADTSERIHAWPAHSIYICLLDPITVSQPRAVGVGGQQFAS